MCLRDIDGEKGWEGDGLVGGGGGGGGVVPKLAKEEADEKSILPR